MTSASIYISSASGTPSSIPNAFSSIASGATGHISDHQNIVDALFYHDYYLSTSSGLRAAIADDTGTGSLVFNTSPNFTGTPTINGVAITTGGSGGSSSLTIANQGTNLTTSANYINFTGAGVTSTNSSGSVTVTIPGGGGGSSSVAIQNSGTLITNAASVLNFTGTGITSITNSGGSVTITTGSSTSTFTNSTLSGSTTNSGSIIGGTLLNNNMVGASTIGSFYMNSNGNNDVIFYLQAPIGSQPYYVFQGGANNNNWGMSFNNQSGTTNDFQIRRMNGTTFNAPTAANWPTTPYAMTISGSTGAVVFPGNSLTIANAFLGAPQNQLPAIPPYAGTFEYDGTAGYFTPNITASSRGVIPTELLTILAASAAIANVANVNSNIFPSRNTITLAANTTYEMQMELWLTGAASTSSQIRLGVSGTASPVGSFMSIFFDATGAAAGGNNSRGSNSLVWTGSGLTGNQFAVVSSSVSALVVKINGFLRNSSSGTFIPQMNFVNAPGSAMYLGTNSYIKLIPIGASATTGTVAWS